MPSASLWVLVAGFLFTLMSMSAKMCSGYFSPFEIIFWRSVFGLVCLFLIMVRKGIGIPTKHPMAHFKRCVCGVGCFLLEILALSRLPLSVEQPIAYTSPLIFCVFFLISSRRSGNRIEWPVVGAVITGFIGVLLIARPTSVGINLDGLLLAVAAALAGASANWFLRDLGRQGEPKERAVFYFMLTGFVAGGAGMIFSPYELHLPQGEWIWPLLGVMTTGCVAQVLWTYAWAKGHALLNSVFQFAGIFFGVLIGMVAFHEHIEMLSLTGIGVIFASGLFSSLYLRRSR